jgi:hypothetical protein
MSHLTLESLARLLDESPDLAERRHLESCAECSAELQALMDQRIQLRTLPDLAPPPDAWPRIRSELRAEGLIRRQRLFPATALRAAAAALVFLAGGAMGYALRGPAAPSTGAPAFTAVDPALPTGGAAATATADPVREVEEAGEQFMAALDRYMANAGSPPSDPAARLAALDNIVLTTAEALHEAPADPIINSYYLSARAQRDAVLRQLGLSPGQPVF